MLYLERMVSGLTETWQEIAARLGVEVTEKALPYGKTHAYVAKGERCVEARPRFGSDDEWTVMVDEYEDYDMPGFLKPDEARDLSDCLQVAARYLEEVHG